MQRLRDVLQSIMGVVLLWAFMIGAGYALIFLNAYYWVWLALIFIFIPLAILIRNRMQGKKRKEDPRH